jgi:hypothetical protein
MALTKITMGIAATNSRKAPATPNQGVVLNGLESNAGLLTVRS